MQVKICQAHEDEILSICFFEGCPQHFLCKECIRCHPDNHNSKIKGLVSLMLNEDWIKLNEEQRDTQVTSIKHYYQEKEDLFSENQKKLQEMFDEIIEFLKKRLSQWIDELDNHLTFRENSKGKDTFTMLEENLKHLTDANFRDGDVYGKVDKCKLFIEDTLPTSVDLCHQVRNVLDEVRIDQSKADAFKEEILKLLQSIDIKNLFTLSDAKFERPFEQLNQLQQEYESFRQEKEKDIESLSQEIKQLQKFNKELEAQIGLGKQQNNELQESNNNHKQNIESLKIAEEDFLKEILTLKTELESTIASKLKIVQELESLNIAHNELIKDSKLKFLKEDSQLINNKDINNLKAWIPRLPNSNNHPCQLKLLYRATRDGFEARQFYSKCENIAPTIGFIKSKEHGRVFGGYTTEKWNANRGGYIKDNDAFIFSLTHGEKYPLKNSNSAIYSHSGYIFTFGADIELPNGCNSINAHSKFPFAYESTQFPNNGIPGAREHLAGSEKFMVEEIEVYQVI